MNGRCRAIRYRGGYICHGCGQMSTDLNSMQCRLAFGGPGTELKKMLSGWPFYIEATPTCPCNRHAATMDEWGCDGCENRIDEIVEWLRLEASKRRLPFSTGAAKILIRRAISRARKKEASWPTTTTSSTAKSGSGDIRP
jgi:predicted Fe-S protein YdhL (DUF1289 family)